MRTTMNLLNAAPPMQPTPYWTERLSLARTLLNGAKRQRHWNPAIARALAEELGKNPKKWIVLAGLQSERDSACKSQMLKRTAKLRCAH